MAFDSSANPVGDISLKANFHSQQSRCRANSGIKFIFYAVVLVMVFSSAEAYDPLDPFGNITVRWDIMSWTENGYLAQVTIYNFQLFRHIPNPGWTLGWTWAKKEVIMTVVGAQAAQQGDCSKFKTAIPHSCSRSPKIVDLLPGAPFNQQFSNCCRGGVLSAWGQDPLGAVSAFQMGVGYAGTSNKTVKLPKNFTLLGPGPGYTCGPAKRVPATQFLTPDHRRASQAMMTWNVTCTYSQFLASKYPSCCVSFSSFYSDTITPCPSCSCGCQNKTNCIMNTSNQLLNITAINSTRKDDDSPLLQCTHHMCPVRVHWHVKLNYRDYWRVKVAITNFNYGKNYSMWTLVAQHPNLNNVTQVFSFNYKPLVAYESINDTGMFYGMKFFNDFLMEAGPAGNVQSEMLLQKNKETFTLRQGWAFPRKVYFNGEECMLPPPDQYPSLPSSAQENCAPFLKLAASLVAMILSIFLS
ncbi:hypothetical protein NMG60_11023932 [Bertholletia excelsa]